MPDSKPSVILPKILRLEFSKAADAGRITRALDPKIKDPFDPDGHAVKRLAAAFNKSVADGCAAFLSDENGEVRTLTMAYHVHVDKNPAEGTQHDHTNFGTSLSLIPGFKSSAVVIAALALREWYVHPPLQTISAGIVPENAPSINIYQNTLSWPLIKDQNVITSAATATWRTLPDPADPTGETCLETAPAELENVGWYDCNEAVIMQQARLVLEVMNRGHLLSPKTGEQIEINLAALEAEGLTRPRLEAMASGVMSRSRLQKLAA